MEFTQVRQAVHDVQLEARKAMIPVLENLPSDFLWVLAFGASQAPSFAASDVLAKRGILTVIPYGYKPMTKSSGRKKKRPA